MSKTLSTHIQFDRQHWKALFFTIWAGQAISLLGSRLVQFALVWYLTTLTRSATVLAMATLVAMLPEILFGPIAGTLVDRWNRRIIMLVSDSVIALATVLLTLLFAFGRVEVWHIYVLMFIRSLGGAFHFPAMTASTTLMVPEEHYVRIAGMNQALIGLLSVSAPPLGALLIELLPMQTILMIDVGTALLAIVPLIFIAIPQPERSESSADGPQKRSVLADLRAGFSFIIGWRGMLLLSLMGLVINLMTRPGVALLPILVTEHFGGGVIQLASLQAAAGIGMILGGLLLSVWGGFKRRIVTAMVALILDGIAILVLGIAPVEGILIAVLALFATGLVEPIIHGSQLAVYQATVPPEMQGRVFSLLIAASTAMVPLGLAIAGPVSDAVGVQVWFMFGGLIAIIMGVGAFFVPDILYIEGEPKS